MAALTLTLAAATARQALLLWPNDTKREREAGVPWETIEASGRTTTRRTRDKTDRRRVRQKMKNARARNVMACAAPRRSSAVENEERETSSAMPEKGATVATAKARITKKKKGSRRQSRARRRRACTFSGSTRTQPRKAARLKNNAGNASVVLRCGGRDTSALVSSSLLAILDTACPKE